MHRDLYEIVGQSRYGSGPSSEVDRRSAGRRDIPVDGSGDGNARDAGGCEGDTQAGGDEADQRRPLWRILDNIGTESAFFTAADGSIEGQRAHAARKEDEWLGCEIADPKRAFASQGMAAGQDGDIAFLEDRGEGFLQWGRHRGGTRDRWCR